GTALAGMRALAAVSPASSAIELPGFIPDDAMNDIWRRAHVFAMPSRNEGFGIVYAEAMRQGLPVIASVHDAGREVNVDRVTGFNVDLDRPGDLEERLIYLLRESTAAKSMGAAGRQRWREHYRFSCFAQRLIQALAEFLPGVSTSAFE